jgi:hypothetical protein
MPFETPSAFDLGLLRTSGDLFLSVRPEEVLSGAKYRLEGPLEARR